MNTNAPADNRSIVLIHGWGFDSSVWGDIAARLRTNFDVKAIDLPGYGKNRPGRLPDFAETVDQILSQIPEGATVVGWSLGGLLAMACALRRPQHIGRLILVGSTPSFVARDGWPHGITPVMLTGFKAAARLGIQNLIRRFAGLINVGDENARNLTKLLAERGDDPEPDHAALMQGLDWLGTLDFRAALSKLDLPVLIIHGERDPLMAFPGAQAMATTFPSARLAGFPGAAHAPFFSDPERFAGEVEAFSLIAETPC